MADLVSPPTLNRPPADPSMADLLTLWKKKILLETNCHAVATIQSFDPEKQTATATINYKKTFSQRNAATGVYESVQKDYPILVDVPVMFLGGGLSCLTFPVVKGDECLVCFNDRDIDNWLISGQIGPVASARLHSFADGIILVGLRSTPNAIADFDTERADLRNGEAHVAVGESLVKIYNSTTTLKTLLQTLITTIKSITTTNAVVGAPCAISAASQTALDNVVTDIAGLLE